MCWVAFYAYCTAPFTIILCEPVTVNNAGSTFRRTVGRDVTDNGHVITGGRGHEHVTGNSVGVILQPHDVDAVEMEVVDDEMVILHTSSETAKFSYRLHEIRCLQIHPRQQGH